MKLIDTFEKPSNTPGIYGILNIVTGRIYIGSSVNVRKRWRQHCSSLRRGEHVNSRLQRSWNKHGPAAFTITVICSRVPPEQLLNLETMAIEAFRSDPDGVYNLAPVAGSMLGYRHTPETRRHLSRALTGRALSEEHKRSIGQGLLNPSQETVKKRKETRDGYRHSDETRAKISTSHVGMTHSGDTKLKISAVQTGVPWTPARRAVFEENGNPNLGRKHTAQACSNMSKAQKGLPKSAEHRRKLAEANTGKQHSEETRSKMSRSHLGRPMSDAQKSYHESRKGVPWSPERRAAHEAKKAKKAELFPPKP